jgi:hypothetical protein
MSVVRFPPRAILLTPAADSGIVTVRTPRGLSWPHSTRWDARRHAAWLSMRYELPVRELFVSTTTTTTTGAP